MLWRKKRDPSLPRVSTHPLLFQAAKKPEKKAAPSAPPKFINPFDEYIRTQEGDTVTLECSVGGNPEPEVKWTMDNRNIENGKASFEVKLGCDILFISASTSQLLNCARF